MNKKIKFHISRLFLLQGQQNSCFCILSKLFLTGEYKYQTSKAKFDTLLFDMVKIYETYLFLERLLHKVLDFREFFLIGRT